MSEEKVYRISDTMRAVSRYNEWRDRWESVAIEMGVYSQIIHAPNGSSQTIVGGDAHNDALRTVISDAIISGNRDKIYGFIDDYFEVYNEENNADFSWTIENFTGYSQGEWLEVVLYSETYGGVLDLKDLAKQLENFWRGECYIVTIEKSKVYTAEDGDTHTLWLPDSDYESAYVTEEFFEITEQFLKDNFNLPSEALA